MAPLPTNTLGATTPVISYAGGATNGVATMTPPDILLPTIMSSIEKACATIPAGQTGAMVALVDTKGANVAVVQKVGSNVKVMGWLGRTWGAPIAGGASIMASW